VNIEACLQATRVAGPGKETADEQGMIRGVHQSRCGQRHWSDAQRELQGHTQQRRAGISMTGLQGSATLLCGVSCVGAALVCAVGEEGGGEVGLWTGVLLAAHVQRAHSMLPLLSSNQHFHSGPHPCWSAAGGFQASFGSCLITAVAREIASGTRCISPALRAAHRAL
jgi:hypothetical protein